MVTEKKVSTKANTVLDKAEESVLAYELITRSPSAWVKEGTQNDKNPIHINCAKMVFLDVRSRWYDGRGEQEIQYVPGANTIFVNDYVDDSGVMQKGLRNQGYDLRGEDYRRAVNEDIAFKNGFLFVSDYGGEANTQLVDFLRHCSSNVGSINYRPNRRHNGMFLFGPLVKEKKATNMLDNLEVEAESVQMFASLRKKIGKDNYEYDTAKIDALLEMLGIGGGHASNESAQKMISLSPYMKDAVKFMDLYNATMDEYKMTIATAKSLKVMSFAEGKANIKIENVLPISIDLEGKKEEDQVENLTYYFIGNESGKVTYGQLTGEVERKKIEALK